MGCGSSSVAHGVEWIGGASDAHCWGPAVEHMVRDPSKHMFQTPSKHMFQTPSKHMLHQDPSNTGFRHPQNNTCVRTSHNNTCFKTPQNNTFFRTPRNTCLDYMLPDAQMRKAPKWPRRVSRSVNNFPPLTLSIFYWILVLLNWILVFFVEF